jgi:DNA primase
MSFTSSGWGGGQAVPGDVVSSLQELGIQIARIIHGEAWAYCPGHFVRLGRQNRHPDKWSINLETGQHSCFSCGFSGSFTTLVREVLGYDYSDADSWVRSRGGVQRLRRALSTALDSGIERSAPRLWNEARMALFADPPGDELARRGLSAGSVVHYGVLWDSENDRWILPIRDEDGKFLGYQEKGPGWVSNKPAQVQKGDTLFGLHCLRGTTLILVESPLDCLRLYTAGIDGAVSSFGVQVSRSQLDLLFDYAEVIIFALDNDEAGWNKSWELRQKYLSSGYRIKFADYSHISWAKDLGTEGVSNWDIQQAIVNSISMLRYRHVQRKS